MTALTRYDKVGEAIFSPVAIGLRRGYAVALQHRDDQPSCELLTASFGLMGVISAVECGNLLSYVTGERPRRYQIVW